DTGFVRRGDMVLTAGTGPFADRVLGVQAIAIRVVIVNGEATVSAVAEVFIGVNVAHPANNAHHGGALSWPSTAGGGGGTSAGASGDVLWGTLNGTSLARVGGIVDAPIGRREDNRAIGRWNDSRFLAGRLVTGRRVLNETHARRAGGFLFDIPGGVRDGGVG